ncbi:MAG: choice-of-anchor D domain-containing protein, partial [Myxococcales bacterium]
MGRFQALGCALLLSACGSASQSKVRALGGILTVAPATLDFGDVALGKEQTHPIVLRNTGLVSMTVGQLAQFADPAFEVKGLPATLGPGGDAQVTVRYRPPQLGTHERMLQMVTDSPESNGADVDLRGHAVRGLATLSGDAFDFGPVVVNEAATQDLLVTNGSDGRAETSVSIAPPPESTAFLVTPPGEQALAAEQSMVVHIQFRPDRLAAFSSAVQITPCPTCSPRQITLTGTGVDKLLLVRPDALDFGNLRLAGEAAQPFTATNTSKSPLVVQSLALAGSGDLTATLDGGPLPRTLSPGETVSGTARFRARNLGTQQTQASISVSDGGPGLLAMTGRGIGPILQATPRSLFVGPAALGTTRTSAVTVTNVGLDPQGNAPLVLSDVRLENNDGSWAVRGGAMAVGGPGASVNLPVSFTPRTAGMSQATLVIESNDGLHPHVEVPVAATGRDLLPCALVVTPASPVDFGAQRLFSPIVGGFELTNRTADDCIVGDPTIVAGAPAFRWPGGVAPAGRTLPPGGRMSVRLEFIAEQAETYSGTVKFYVSNRSAPSMTVDLTGSGDPSCFFVTPPTVDFGATTVGCGIPSQFAYAVNQCSFPVTVRTVDTTGTPFSASATLPLRLQPDTNSGIAIGYRPQSVGDDVGVVRVYTDMRAEPFQSGITGGAQVAATIVDQWDQSTPKVDLLMVIDNSGSMLEEQRALAQNLDRLWNRIALANADFHIAITTTGMFPYTSGFAQCPGGASGGEAGRFFPVDNSRPRILTPQTPDVKSVLFANTNVGICHYDERFLDPVLAALTDPLISATKAPGTPFPNDGNAGFLRDDARLALLAVSDADDANDQVSPAPVSDYVRRLAQVKKGALDLISFAGIVPLSSCPTTAEGVGTRYKEIARQLGGHLEDICDLSNFGRLLESSLGDLLLPLTSFPLSAHPRDPSAMVVTVDGATVTSWTYEAASNRLAFPVSAVPPPGSHITARYEPACL